VAQIWIGADTKPGQAERVGVGLEVDQQQVGLDMTFPIACPIARKIVIAVAGIQGLIRRQGDQTGLRSSSSVAR